MEKAITRRTALKALGTAAVLPWLSDERAARVRAHPGDECRAAAQGALARRSSQTLEVLVEAIIPADDRSPGAKQARVADYIDLLLSEVDRRAWRCEWIGGLAALDAEAMSRFRAPFSRLGAASGRRDPRRPSAATSATPQTPLETFFVMAKQATVRGYYTSKIGIHDELRYKGNQFLREFVGCQTEDGKDCPHCGQKHLKSSASDE